MSSINNEIIAAFVITTNVTRPQYEHTNIYSSSINGTTGKKDAATEDHGVSPTQRRRDVAGQER